jgi:hypothetical protein
MGLIRENGPYQRMGLIRENGPYQRMSLIRENGLYQRMGLIRELALLEKRTTVLFTGLWAFKETFNNISVMMRNSLKLVEKTTNLQTL